MRIEKIELTGFKSFADRTVFSLHSGMTCIVGPNGCGKSNIVDAFRWVLGEQSAKSLRGEKMEEVIFNGSASKKQKGMAEVTLHVSGLSSSLPSGNGDGSHGQTDTVLVTRRLYRSGESEYIINKQACRLKDIRDVFLDTGLDFKSYSILEQGRINAILNSKPLERRFIIEEAAGVMKYKVRKAEAMTKLESSRLNLSRISDIITEVRKQLNILDRLAKKAERYRKLKEELNAIELKMSRRQYQDLTDSMNSINEEYGSLKEKEALVNAEINEIENRTETRRIGLVEKEKELDSVQQRFQSLERDIAETNRQISVSQQDINNFGEFHSKYIQQTEELLMRMNQLVSRYSDLNENSTKIYEEIETSASILSQKADAFKMMELELSDKEEAIEEQRKRIFRASDDFGRARNEAARYQNSMESFEKKEALSHSDAESTRHMLAEIETAIVSAESDISGQNSELLLLREKKTVLERELTDYRSGLDKLAIDLSTEREEMASCTSRLSSLKEIVFDKTTRDLLEASGNVDLLASVSDVIEVRSEYEKAIENALFEKADSFIVRSLDDIRHAVEDLRDKQVDRTSFITVEPPEHKPGHELPAGIVGRALDLVKIRQGFERVAANLLSGLLVVNDIQTAFDLSRSCPDFEYVTVSGEFIDASGAVIVGGERGIFRRKRETRELEQQIEEQRSSIEAMNNRMRELQETIRSKEEDITSVVNALHNLEKELSLTRLTMDNYMSEKGRVSRKLSMLMMEIEQIAAEKDSIRISLQRSEEETLRLDTVKTALDNELQQMQEGISQKKAELETIRSEVTDLRMQATANRERLDSIKNEIAANIRTREELERKQEDIQEEITALNTRVQQRKEEIVAHESRLRSLVSDADAVSREMTVRKDEIEKENEELFAVEHALRSMRHDMSAITSRIAELDVARAEHKMQLSGIIENVRVNYGSEISEIELLDLEPGEEDKAVELRSKIQEIGPVNLGTLDEYEELRTRYEFMTKQQEDLNRSIAELEEAISKINGTTRKKLREAFEALRLNFSTVFTTLFGGGRAELVLTDESNILETGLDIIAQPPGKKIQNIHLLSGGEQALTALSLQFASFLIKPTPLCILDEADAPLDEANTDRYARMLLEMSGDTQFIVVTHNRTTMSVAQHIYGITMEEAGVSRVISMQLAEV